GRNLLKVSTYVLRQELDEGAIVSAGDDLCLDPAIIRADVADFEAALAAADDAGAVALYRGPLLDGFFISNAPEFEQWVDRERERLARSNRAALERLAERAEEAGDVARAVEWWKSRAADDPYDSRVALRLMQALEASGNRAGALQHAAVHQRLLESEFGVAPPPEIAAFAERLRREPVRAAPQGLVPETTASSTSPATSADA